MTNKMQAVLVSPENNCLTAGLLSADYSFCKYFLRAEQVATDDQINNIAGTGVAAPRLAGYAAATLWANGGYATVGGGASKYCTLLPAVHDLSLAIGPVVIALRVKKVAATYPAANDFILSSFTTTASPGGIQIIVPPAATTARVKLTLSSVDNSEVTVFAPATTDGQLVDGATAPVEHSYVWVCNPATGNMVMGCNGLTTAASATTAGMIGKSLAGGNTMIIGNSLNNGQNTDAYKIAGLAAYQLTGLMPNANVLARIYDWVARHPASPMPNWMFS